MDNPDPVIKINALERITSCELSVIVARISWDQNGYLYTTQKVNNGYSLDNYRLIQAFHQIYPQWIARSLHLFE
ncbi:hypothetical protein E4Y66_06660 [Salmonella enterica]|nr:hypothetical protein [Salmonella enterica]